MCSTPKSSAVTPVKKIPTSSFSKSDFSSFVAVANAAAERKEEKEQAEKERLANRDS